MNGLLLAGGAATALFASALAVPAQAADGPTSSPPSEKIVFQINTVNGSGCKAGTAAVATTSDNTAFTVTYSDYTALAGSGSGPTDFRKNCQLNLSVHVPQGFTYAVASADYRGYAYLPSGASAMQKASYYFAGEAATSSATHNFAGPYNQDWETVDSTPVAELVWAPCGEDRNFNINTELRVTSNSSAATSFVSMDSTDGSVNTTYQLAWEKCDS